MNYSEKKHLEKDNPGKDKSKKEQLRAGTNLKKDSSEKEKSEKGQFCKPDIAVNKSDIVVNKSDIVVNKSDIAVTTIKNRIWVGKGVRALLVYTCLCSVANYLYICLL